MTVGHGNVRVTEVWQKLSDFAIMRLSFILVLRFSLRDQDKEGKMRKEGRKEMFNGVTARVSLDSFQSGVSGSVNVLELKSSSFIKK